MEGRGRFCCCRSLVVQFVVLVALTKFAHCSLSSEIAENKVEVRFDGIYKLEYWEDSQTANFTNAVTTAVNTYCQGELTECQITAYSSSSPFSVVIADGDVEYFNGDIKITFHVRLPDADVDPSSDLEYVLAEAVVTEIVKMNTTVAAINAATGATLSYVGNQRLEPIDYSLDVIMIPIVCVLFLIVVLMAVFLACKQSHGEKKKQQQVAMSTGGHKGEEGITLTAVKNTSDDSGENNEVKA